MATQTKSNKYYSNRQETMIAKYLGWGQVSGSGARPFTPGDVNSFQWLGECKTHNEERSNIMFLKIHWFKITEEARAKNKYPVLFVDNGTQESANTWIMTPLSIFDPSIVNVLDGLKNTSTKGNSLTFDYKEGKELYKKTAVAEKFNVFKIHWDRDLAVMPLSTFRDYIEEYF